MSNEDSLRTAEPSSPRGEGGVPLRPRDDLSTHHFVRSSNRLIPPFKAGLQSCVFAAGCFWGTEKGFWRLPGVYSTAVGYVGGTASRPTYHQVCSGRTGHTEATLVVWDPSEVAFSDLLRRFFDCHDPTQGDGQGNDRGSQYRSGIYTADEEQAQAARACLAAFNAVLKRAGYKSITTEVQVRSEFWFAEPYHQQYLAKPGARLYCSAEPTGQPVPPVARWGLPAPLAAKFAPLLPEAFWGGYDGSIHTTDAPAQLDAAALAEAREMRQRLRDEAAAAEAALRQDAGLDGLIRFCGGCGFHARAEQLADHLKAVASVRLGLVQDVGVTGNFDVEVRSREGGFSLIHSKAGNGDGFVDTEKKMAAILAALGAAKADAGFAERALPAALRFEPIERAAREAAEAEATAAAEAPRDEAVLRRAQAKYPRCVIGDESIMRPKAHGTSATPVLAELRWGVDRAMAGRIGNHNRHYAEPAGYFRDTTFVAESAGKAVVFYDSNTRQPLFHVGGPAGRDWGEFVAESADHGWPSFRDGDVNWEHVRVLPDGETVSTAGTHLGHNIPDKKGNRFCINLVCVAAAPPHE